MSNFHPAGPVSAGYLLTAIPGLLGYIPDPSVILLAFYEGQLEATMRYDLVFDADDEPLPEVIATLQSLGRIIERYRPDAVVMVIHDDRCAPHALVYRDIIELADDVCVAAGGITAGYVVSRFAAGGVWRCIWQQGALPAMLAAAPSEVEEGAHGLLGDPRHSPVAVAAAVHTGRRVLASRAEMAEMLSPQPHCVGADCGYTEPQRSLCRIPSAVSARIAGESTAIIEQQMRREADDVAELVRLVVAQASHPQPLTCELLRELERALLTPVVRDAALTLGVSEVRAGAERLWRELTRRLSGSGRASAATMLGHLHYMAGEGAYAGVALDVALAADPHWTLAELLDTALRNGMPPVTLWGVLSDAYDIAEGLGVSLPPPAMRSVG